MRIGVDFAWMAKPSLSLGSFAAARPPDGL